MTPPAGAPASRPAWPVRSGTVPALADAFSARPDTAPGLAAALPAGAAVALVPGSAAAGQGRAAAVAGRAPSPPAAGGQAAAPATRDWPRSSGKTQLAAAFAESLWQSGGVDLLVWIDATSRASVLSGYAAATAAVTGRAQVSTCESVAAQFLSWLGETTRPWLLVLDDLADPASLRDLWPAGPAGRVLVTSADATAVPGGIPVVPVGPFSVREAVSHLNGRLSGDPDKRHGAVELAQELDLEPVALAQASAVIAGSPLTCREYRDHFGRRREQLAQSSGAWPAAAAVTWTLSLDRADQLVPGSAARSLLALAAVLDGHGIPRTVLTAPAAADHLAGAGSPQAGGDRATAALDALAALEQAGLLAVEHATAPPLVRISPVLQPAVRASLPESLLRGAARAAADALLQAWPEQEPPGWPSSGLRSCAAALRRAGGSLLWAGGCHRVLIRAGDSLDRARLTGPAADHWRDVATTCALLLGEGHPDTMLAVRRLAGACLAAGQAGEAVRWRQWLLGSLSHRLGPDHPEVADARRHLGNALVAARELPAAIAALERAAAGLERLHGPGHAEALDARDDLAAAYLAAGRHVDALTACRRTLADRERAQGARHPKTMATRHGLARSLLAGGRAREAVAAYRRVVADRERVLGPDHPDTLAALSGLASAYQETGRAVAAELACERAWAGSERVLGPRDPGTLRIRAQLARLYQRLGRYGDARVLLRDTVHRLERIVPGDDPLIAELRQSLADIGEE